MVRAVGLSAVAAGALTLGVSSMPPAPQARAEVAPTLPLNVKVATRIESWNGPLAPTKAVAASSPAAPVAQWSLLGAEPSGTLAHARFALAGAPALQASTLLPAATRSEWQEREFAEVAVVDGRTLDAGGVRIRLSGLALPSTDEACRTLDARIEACATRAATQLELITRWRKVTCRYQPLPSGDAAGTCRVGSTDLAERLLKAGYVRRLDPTPGAPGRA